ncbi:outer membrane beta-barrel protein [Sulfurimonas sp.]|uniref:outer membrane beta-barrel protein n=1 Tax=Sulfurimonas sp. TaxID=2022749 RepID=UPI002B46E77D|nr:outer membrane beta-barrel protein [Sulfurimonas sp.]
MAKTLSKLAVATILVASSLSAAPADNSKYRFNTNSLIGLEGTYSNFDYERVKIGDATVREKVSLKGGGLKIGAESNNYRFFLSARMYDAGEFEYARTYGVELQYLFNFSNFANMYLGVNFGKADMKFVDTKNGHNNTVTIDDTYLGGDVGFNVHLGKQVDWEIGARFMRLNTSKTDAGATYNLDHIVTGYTSIIFKYQMD